MISLPRIVTTGIMKLSYTIKKKDPISQKETYKLSKGEATEIVIVFARGKRGRERKREKERETATENTHSPNEGPLLLYLSSYLLRSTTPNCRTFPT